MDNFHRKTVVITGAASGIGAGIARSFAREGSNVVLGDVADAHEVAAACAAEGVQAIPVHVDVTSRESMNGLADVAYGSFGRVDVLCNNAGVVAFGGTSELSEADWDWLLGVNLRGVINGVGVFVPRMLAQGGESHVVNTASGAGLVASGALPLGGYTTSKYAIVGLSESLRNEMAPHGIGVSVLCPGAVQTSILHSARYTPATEHLRPATTGAPTPSREGIRRMQPDDVGKLVVRAVRLNHLYALTHPEERAAFEARSKAIIEAFDDTALALQQMA
ncbi:MAG TPA: SDR family NAD(P)-dependent oxidoreductase [Tepidiformaceae bacterium]|nr:SDR family NAD(P)-dependent oxidoreductase [Tepidiformaceae bacterium]